MKNLPRALATCAAFAITFAACGDDDTASDDTTPFALESSGDTNPAGPADAGQGTVGEPSPSPSMSVPDDVAADCLMFEELVDALPEIDAPAAGEEISDDYRDAIRGSAEEIEALDLASDEGRAARDSLVDGLNTVADADTMTEELQSLGDSDDLVAFGHMCLSVVAPS